MVFSVAIYLQNFETVGSIFKNNFSKYFKLSYFNDILGGKIMDHLYGERRKITSCSLTSHALVIEPLQYQLPVSITFSYGSTS